MSQRSKHRTIEPWVPETPIKLKVVHTGWLPDDYGCPHCKKTMTGIIVRTLKFLDYWWLCECGGGREIKEAYEACPGEHVNSLGYYQNCAWKIQERVWPK